MPSAPKSVREIPAKWDDILFVCRKCGKKLDGGFGPDGSDRLDKVLRKALKQERSAKVKIVPVSCLKICPKNAVTVIKAGNPRQIYLVAEDADAFETLESLGLRERVLP